MTTVAQVKQVVRPLLQQNSDLALVGRLVVVKPVHHILRGIYIDRSSDPLLFMPTWAVIFLFEPCQGFSYNWGRRLYRPLPGPGAWDISNPTTSAAMSEEIQRVLPLLRPIQTIDDFVGFTSEHRFRDTYLDLYEHRKIFVDVARGDIEAARTICAYFATDRARRRYLPFMQEEYDRITKTLCPLVAANDRPGLAQLLHDFEAGSAKGLKLNKLWEPTPFPIELL
ncbi:MAG TPA: hypothetical protein VFL53_16855 [Pseudolabrys sp.]|nr:hypothetical protein [Pseudolabrys sp.]